MVTKLFRDDADVENNVENGQCGPLHIIKLLSKDQGSNIVRLSKIGFYISSERRKQVEQLH